MQLIRRLVFVSSVQSDSVRPLSGFCMDVYRGIYSLLVSLDERNAGTGPLIVYLCCSWLVIIGWWFCRRQTFLVKKDGTTEGLPESYMDCLCC